MKINYVIICDNAFTDDNGRLSLIQTFDSIKSMNFPAIHPRMTVVTNILLDDEDKKGNKYSEEVVIVDKNNLKEIAKANAEIATTNDTKRLQNIFYFVGLSFENKGEFDVIVRINGGEVYRTTLYVTKVNVE